MSEQNTESTTEATAGATPNDVAATVSRGLNEPSTTTDAGETPKDDDTNGAGSKAAILADLATERDKRQAAEREVQTFQQEAATLRQQVEEIPKTVAGHLRDHLVQIHQISDEDAALFLTSDDPETLLKQVTRFVQRTAAVEAAPTTPKPDLSQGGQQAPALNSDALEAALKAKLGIA
ncbi:MAG TPA: hypothetical protein VK045_01830 [Ornithinicoccus sp.]|nr:hypothetical protein [Ornithinicoccus sp.]